MFLLDVNVVLAAHRQDHPHHALARGWIDELLASRAPFAVPVSVWASFVRLSTNRRVFAVPTPRAEAFAFVRALREQPAHLTLAPGPRHLALLERLCEEGDASGDLVPDAVLAAVAVEHDCDLVTFDRDFARFAMVRSHRPGAST